MNSAPMTDLTEIMKAMYYRPTVSIILPFEPKMSQKAVLTHSLKIAADKVEKELKEHYPAEIVILVMNKLWTIIKNLNFNTFKKSIAIYLSPVFEKILYLDIPVDEKITVDESFDIRDLVRDKKELRQYLVLLLNNKECRMYLGDSKSFVKIIADTPKPIYAVKNDSPERVSDFSDISGHSQMIMDKFLQRIDYSLGVILHSYHLPLFVMGTKKIVTHFKSLSKHASAVVDYIYGNYEDATDEQLKNVLEPYTNQWKKVREKDLMNQLQEAATTKKLAVGMRDVWREAMSYKGRLLVVEENYTCSDQRCGNKNVIYMSSKPYNKFSHIKDGMDDIIEKVLDAGGDVEFVDKDVLKDYQHIALIE